MWPPMGLLLLLTFALLLHDACCKPTGTAGPDLDADTNPLAKIPVVRRRILGLALLLEVHCTGLAHTRHSRNMTDLSASDIEDVKEVFDLFDFWDGRDGLVDGFKIGDLLRCIGLNPTIALVKSYGGTDKLDVKEVFDLFDFWDGRDGLVDGAKLADFLYACGMNPTLAVVQANGGTEKLGEKQYKFEEILPIYAAVAKDTDSGTYADFMEAFKTFDREGQGFISGAEMRHVLSVLGERLSDEEVSMVIKFSDLQEDLDGNVKYEDFIKAVMGTKSS